MSTTSSHDSSERPPTFRSAYSLRQKENDLETILLRQHIGKLDNENELRDVYKLIMEVGVYKDMEVTSSLSTKAEHDISLAQVVGGPAWKDCDFQKKFIGWCDEVKDAATQRRATALRQAWKEHAKRLETRPQPEVDPRETILPVVEDTIPAALGVAEDNTSSSLPVSNPGFLPSSPPLRPSPSSAIPFHSTAIHHLSVPTTQSMTYPLDYDSLRKNDPEFEKLYKRYLKETASPASVGHESASQASRGRIGIYLADLAIDVRVSLRPGDSEVNLSARGSEGNSTAGRAAETRNTLMSGEVKPVDTMNPKWRKVPQYVKGMAQTLAYLIQANQIGGTWLGIFFLGSQFARVVMIDEHTIAIEFNQNTLERLRGNTSDVQTSDIVLNLASILDIDKVICADGMPWDLVDRVAPNRPRGRDVVHINERALHILRDYAQTAYELALDLPIAAPLERLKPGFGPVHQSIVQMATRHKVNETSQVREVIAAAREETTYLERKRKRQDGGRGSKGEDKSDSRKDDGDQGGSNSSNQGGSGNHGDKNDDRDDDDKRTGKEDDDKSEDSASKRQKFHDNSYPNTTTRRSLPNQDIEVGEQIVLLKDGDKAEGDNPDSVSSHATPFANSYPGDFVDRWLKQTRLENTQASPLGRHSAGTDDAGPPIQQHPVDPSSGSIVSPTQPSESRAGPVLSQTGAHQSDDEDSLPLGSSAEDFASPCSDAAVFLLGSEMSDIMVVTVTTEMMDGLVKEMATSDPSADEEQEERGCEAKSQGESHELLAAEKGGVPHVAGLPQPVDRGSVRIAKSSGESTLVEPAKNPEQVIDGLGKGRTGTLLDDELRLDLT
ncbi:hypothetical protein P7C73_g6239, partial [Tremellales sp. Uapishka_1]